MTVHFTVDEQDERKSLNTPGANELLARCGGPAGLPFLAFLDSKGGVIVNSIRPGEKGKPGGNIGHPFEPFEVDWFLAMVRKAAPSMKPEEAAAIEKHLRGQKKGG